jgi:hypothetical protein
MRAPKAEKHSGVFYPTQIEAMHAELELGDQPSETKAGREQRAADIIRRKPTRPDIARDPQLPG